jgi:hypothetical protein
MQYLAPSTDVASLMVNRRYFLSGLRSIILAWLMTSSYSFSTTKTTQQQQQTFVSRRQTFKHLFEFSTILPLVDFAAVAVADDTEKEQGDAVPKTETPQEKQKREMKEKIAASKKNFRKGDSYAMERFTTVDYSCVADTGSPCKEGKSVFPSDEKIRVDGKIEDL